jgi:hypothetical protein
MLSNRLSHGVKLSVYVVHTLVDATMCLECSSWLAL